MMRFFSKINNLLVVVLTGVILSACAPGTPGSSDAINPLGEAAFTPPSDTGDDWGNPHRMSRTHPMQAIFSIDEVKNAVDHGPFDTGRGIGTYHSTHQELSDGVGTYIALRGMKQTCREVSSRILQTYGTYAAYEKKSVGSSIKEGIKFDFEGFYNCKTGMVMFQRVVNGTVEVYLLDINSRTPDYSPLFTRRVLRGKMVLKWAIHPLHD